MPDPEETEKDPFSAVDFQLDFDLDDFDLSQLDGMGGEAQERVLKPRIDLDQITHTVTFQNAESFADQIDLTPGARTFAWVNGAFVFGDIIEALMTRRGVFAEEIYISTLGISQENIDSLRTILEIGHVKKLRMLISGFFYSHEKHTLVPYLYDQLDYNDVTQIAFGNYHGKIILIRTAKGNTITIHGSANLRSSNSIEQIMVEVNNDDLYSFNANIINDICDRFGTINHDVVRVPGKAELWQVVAPEA